MEALCFILYLTDNYSDIDMGDLKGQKKMEIQNLDSVVSIPARIWRQGGTETQFLRNQGQRKIHYKATSCLVEPKGNREIPPTND